MTQRAPGEFGPHMTLEDAQHHLRELVWDGHRCPCCTQFAKVYRWSLYATAGAMLLRLYQAGGTTEFIESKTVKAPGEGGHGSQLRHWGLVEQESERRDDGGRSGWWRVTEVGEQFALGLTTIPKYVWVYDGRCLKRDGAAVTIRDVLGKKFRYDEIMQPAPIAA